MIAAPIWLGAAGFAATGWCHVQRGVRIEKPNRPERETGPLDRHDRPVLGAWQMMAAEGVPEHDVGVLDGPVRLGPLREPGPAGMLVRVFPGGKPLAGRERRHPQVPGREHRPPDERDRKST